MRYYLIPDLHRLAPRDIYLLGFYTDKMLVADGLMFWKFFNQNVPLLSYRTQGQQASILRDISNHDGLPKLTLKAYSDLVQEGIVEHVWLGEERWTIEPGPAADPRLRVILQTFSRRFKEQRVAVVENIRSLMTADVRLDHAQAINDARYTAYAEIIRQMRSDTPDFAKYEADLAAEFDRYQDGYMKSERFPAQPGGKQPARSRYSGDLADVLQDLSLHNDLCPIFASPEVSDLLNHPAIDQALKTPSVDSRSHVEFLLGLLLLQKLPHVHFANTDDMLMKRSRLHDEFEAYHAAMRGVASTIDIHQTTEDIQDEIVRKVDRELLPAVNSLRDAVLARKRPMGVSEQVTVVSGASSVILGAALGNIPTIVTGVISSLAATGAWLVERQRAHARFKNYEAKQAYKGLSLTLDLEK